MKNNRRAALFSVLGISLLIFNFTRLKGSECIRPIHVVTLITMGALLGVLLTNLVALVKNKNVE